MRIPKSIKVIIAIVVLIVICANAYIGISRLKEKEGYKYTYLWDKIEKLGKGEEVFKDIESLGVIETVEILFYDRSLWDKLPLSSNFINKFKSPKGIIKKYR